jgi:hypothetical protein
VKPERATKADDLANWPWWQFWRVRRELQDACNGLRRVLVVAQTGNALAFVFRKLPTIFSHTVVVFPTESFAFFAVLQSRVHQCWALFFAATMKDDARYIPDDCFLTFSFPEHFNGNAALEAAGAAYYEFRAALMVRNNEGLTKTYNRFHFPEETSQDILKLRELHAAMDRAVLDAYGWTDIPTDCQFLLDYEEDEDEDGEAGAACTRSRKKPWRYRWPEDIRDEVLARLFDLNAKRAEQERLSGAAVTRAVVAKPKKAAVARDREAELSLFEAAYPSAETDRMICAASLVAIELTSGLGSSWIR